MYAQTITRYWKQFLPRYTPTVCQIPNDTTVVQLEYQPTIEPFSVLKQQPNFAELMCNFGFDESFTIDDSQVQPVLPQVPAPLPQDHSPIHGLELIFQPVHPAGLLQPTGQFVSSLARLRDKTGATYPTVIL